MRPRAEARGAGSLGVPLAVYAAVAIVVPLLRRADRREGFWEHAAITLLVPAILMMAWIAVSAVARAAARHGRR